jgi:hypothetical protein
MTFTIKDFPIVFPSQNPSMSGYDLPNKHIHDTALLLRAFYAELMNEWKNGDNKVALKYRNPLARQHPLYNTIVKSKLDHRGWFGTYVRSFLNSAERFSKDLNGVQDYEYSLMTYSYTMTPFEKITPYFDNSYLFEDGVYKARTAYTKQQRKYILDNYKGHLVFYNKPPEWVKETRQLEAA